MPLCSLGLVAGETACASRTTASVKVAATKCSPKYASTQASCVGVHKPPGTAPEHIKTGVFDSQPRDLSICRNPAVKSAWAWVSPGEPTRTASNRCTNSASLASLKDAAD